MTRRFHWFIDLSARDRRHSCACLAGQDHYYLPGRPPLPTQVPLSGPERPPAGFGGIPAPDGRGVADTNGLTGASRVAVEAVALVDTGVAPDAQPGTDGSPEAIRALPLPPEYLATAHPGDTVILRVPPEAVVAAVITGDLRTRVRDALGDADDRWNYETCDGLLPHELLERFADAVVVMLAERDGEAA